MSETIVIVGKITHTLEINGNIFVGQYLERESMTSFDADKRFYATYKGDKSYVSINELEKKGIEYKISEFKAYIPEFK